ncbi:MAG TPA: hypothetical protein VGP07_21055, partial [Polyangia bacterium]
MNDEPRPAPSVLTRLQRGLETLYRVDTRLQVEQFVISESQRNDARTERAPREQVLLRQEGDDDLGLGLFVDGDALSNLERNDPAARLDDDNFADFCLAVEGVSHFIYLALCAAEDRRVSALELELQAEVDKFACCALLTAPDRSNAPELPELRRRLYDEVSFAADLDDEEHDRYRVANAEARRYARVLDHKYMASRRVPDMLPELRRFYR